MADEVDEKELGAWMREYTPRLLGVARAFAQGADEAEDILQEVWILAYRRAHARPPEMPIGAWLHSVTLNVARSGLRRLRRRLGLRERWAVDLPRPGGNARVPEIERELRRARLWQKIARLPALQRETVLLRIVEEMSTREAAEVLGRAEGTVKASLHRALHRLRGELENDQEPEIDSMRRGEG